MAFDPSKSFDDNMAGIAGSDWYSKVAKNMGGNSSDTWNEAINGLRNEFQGQGSGSGVNRGDANAQQAWVQKVRSITGTAAPAFAPAPAPGPMGGGGGGIGGAQAPAPAGQSASTSFSGGASGYSGGVADRVRSLTDQGSPLMTAARTRAKQAMSRSGLQNSSLAGQAGEQAVIDSAMPIAQADAQLAQQRDLAAMQLAESARQFDTNIGWDKEKFGGTLLEQRRQFDANFGLDSKRVDLEAQQFGQRLQLERDNLAAQREQFAQRLGLDVQQLELSRNQLSQQDRQFLAELDQKQQQLAQQESQFTREQANRVTLANLDAANRKELMQLEASYKQDIAGNENISRAWGSMMESINQIQNNPELDASAKYTMIQNVQGSFAAFANFWKKSTGGKVDVGDLLNFGPSRVPVSGSSTGGGRDMFGRVVGEAIRGSQDKNGDGVIDEQDQD